jgi:2-succinyl-6-hydroxy-2,4-cyclohexadiene-1-carboxylate synthase
VLPLHAELSGPDEVAEGENSSTPLALLHGFTQTGRLWGEFGTDLEDHHRLVRIDLPGHGSSAAVAADLWESADLVVEAVGAATGSRSAPFDLCGYSLGGRLALHVALSHPEAVRHLIVISATAGIDDDEARKQRRIRDEEMARELEFSDDVGAFVERWLAAPMFAGLRAGAAEREERERNTATGLASSLRHAGTGTQVPLWDRLGEIAVPVLVMAGADDPRFVQAAVRMRDRIRHASLALVPGAGHAAHLQQPQLTARTISTWLQTVGA